MRGMTGWLISQSLRPLSSLHAHASPPERLNQRFPDTP
jgi:hypothetical protein